MPGAKQSGSAAERPDRVTIRRTEILVVGLGGVGSAVAHVAAAQGLEVVGLEQFAPLHDRGSSHGHSRIFRIAYFESPAYVPMALRSLEGWRALEKTTDQNLLTTTGGLDMGPPSGRLVPGALAACATHGIDHEHWDSAELARRAPGLSLPQGVEAVFQPDAAILNPTRSTGAHLNAARTAGADLHFRARVCRLEPGGEGVRVRAQVEGTEGEVEYLAERVIVTAGAWLGHLMEGSELPEIVPERQVVGWLPHIEGSGARHRFPVVNADLEEGHVYFMPEHDGRGVKVGLYHHRHEAIRTPDTPDDAPDAADRELLQGIADRYLAVSHPIRHMRTCRFTLTPDEHFILDTLHAGRVVVGGGFSGHGFKFAPALGEILTALALGQTPPVPIEPFRLARFAVQA